MRTAREVNYEVIILGGGPAGIAAAWAAADNGADVLLVEKQGFLGGMSTGGLLNVWCGDASCGIYRTIRGQTTEKRARRCVYSPESLKSLYIRELEKRGVSILLHTEVIEATLDNHRIRFVTLLGKGERISAHADIFIDATGDGELACYCGVPYQKGRPSDGLMQPVTLMFMVGGVEEKDAVYPTFGTHPKLEEQMAEYVQSGKILSPAGHVILIEGFNHGTACVNMTNIIRVDGTDVFHLTQAELLAQKQVPQIITFLRECVPGYENCYLLQTACYTGVRETRHFAGEYCLSEQDIQNQTVFDDWVVSRASACFGNHSLTGSGSDVNNLPYHGERYTIPYRSFLPKGVDNLFLCGRNISGTHMAHSSYRVMPICFAMGQGVGTAAAVAVRDSLPIREVPVGEVQQLLLRSGVDFPKQQ